MNAGKLLKKIDLIFDMSFQVPTLGIHMLVEAHI